MRKLFVLALVVWSGACYAQFQPTPINFGKLHYDVEGQRLPQSDLERIINTFSSFGDNEVLFREVVNGLIIQRENVYADSLLHLWQNAFSAEDSIALSQLPPLSDDFRERAFLLFRMTLFVNAYVEKQLWMASAMKLLGSNAAAFSHLPETDQYPDAVLSMAHDYYSHSQWCLQFPEECQFFADLLIAQTATVFPDEPEQHLSEMIEIVRKDIEETGSIYKVYWPYPLAEINDYFLGNSEKEASLMYAELCNPKQIDEFIKKSYTVIYGQPIDDGTLKELVSLVRKHELYDPQMIYIAMIRHRYE